MRCGRGLYSMQNEQHFHKIGNSAKGQKAQSVNREKLNTPNPNNGAVGSNPNQANGIYSFPGVVGQQVPQYSGMSQYEQYFGSSQSSQHSGGAPLPGAQSPAWLQVGDPCYLGNSGLSIGNGSFRVFKAIGYGFKAVHFFSYYRLSQLATTRLLANRLAAVCGWGPITICG